MESCVAYVRSFGPSWQWKCLIQRVCGVGLARQSILSDMTRPVAIFVALARHFDTRLTRNFRIYNEGELDIPALPASNKYKCVHYVTRRNLARFMCLHIVRARLRMVAVSLRICLPPCF